LEENALNMNDWGNVPNFENLPGCAIKAAIAAGELDLGRWESYKKLKDEAVDRDEMMRRKREWSKGVAKFTKQRNKEIW
jgi:ribosome biogenesis GTPase